MTVPSEMNKRKPAGKDSSGASQPVASGANQAESFPGLGGNGNKTASTLTACRYSSLGGSQACRPQPTRLTVLPYYLISNIVSRVAMHDAGSGWSLGRHYRQCGQSCPCCRFAAGDIHGYCDICSQGQQIAIVSSSFWRLVMGMPYTWRPFTAGQPRQREPRRPVVQPHVAAAAAAS